MQMTDIDSVTVKTSATASSQWYRRGAMGGGTVVSCETPLPLTV